MDSQLLKNRFLGGNCKKKVNRHYQPSQQNRQREQRYNKTNHSYNKFIIVRRSHQQMAQIFHGIVSSEAIPGYPLAAFDDARQSLVHVYQNVQLDTSNFQGQVTSYLNRKESQSKNVAAVFKIKDQHISYNMGVAELKVSIVSDYVPWRFHLYDHQITYEEALFLLNGSLKGFRELLHRTRIPFIIKDHMIGVDESGEVKVWWNEYFYRSNFGFAVNGEIKLQDMLKSLISLVVNKMESDQADKLQKILMQGPLTYFNLLEKVKQISRGLNLQTFGIQLVKQCKEFPLVMQERTDLISSRVASSANDQLRLSKLSSTDKLVLSPTAASRKKFEFAKDKSSVITKRVFQNGNAPNTDQKLQIIKQDIEQLRQGNEEKPTATTLEQKFRPSSKSIGSIYSFRRGLHGDTNIPEVNKIIKESEVIERKEELTISRFVDPTPKNNPESCGVCHQLNFLRKAQSFSDYPQIEASSPLMLKLNSLGNEKDGNLTPRSLKNINSELTFTPKAKIGDSQVNTSPSQRFFSSVMKSP